MNFSISGGSGGIVGVIVLFGALMMAVVIAFLTVQRIMRGPDDPSATEEQAPKDDYPL